MRRYHNRRYRSTCCVGGHVHCVQCDAAIAIRYRFSAQAPKLCDVCWNHAAVSLPFDLWSQVVRQRVSDASLLLQDASENISTAKSLLRGLNVVIGSKHA